MRILKAENEFLYFNKLFSFLTANHCELVLWQHLSDGKRIVGKTHLNSFHNDSKLLHFDKPSFEIAPLEPVYCYFEAGQIIFKCAVNEVAKSSLSLKMPLEIQEMQGQEEKPISGGAQRMSRVWKSTILTVDNLNDLGPSHYKIKPMDQRSGRDQKFLNNEFEALTLEQEDKIFAEVRESPRARPKSDKKVKVKHENGAESYTCKLHDLSRGGLGFIAEDNELFNKFDKVIVVGFDEFDLDDPLIGTVMSIRPVNEENFEWKVGIKFEEGQS